MYCTPVYTLTNYINTKVVHIQFQIVTQPMCAVWGEPERPRDYSALAILSCICCFPLGLIAIVYAFQVTITDPIPSCTEQTNLP